METCLECEKPDQAACPYKICNPGLRLDHNWQVARPGNAWIRQNPCIARHPLLKYLSRTYASIGSHHISDHNYMHILL